MKARRRRKAVPLPLMMTNLTLASWETIARRTLLMAQNTCSAAEYRRMVHEKAQAALASSRILVASGGPQISTTPALGGYSPQVSARPGQPRTPPTDFHSRCFSRSFVTPAVSRVLLPRSTTRRSHEATAISIAAKIIALQERRLGGQLTENDLPVHSARLPASTTS
jgi:hypothetical protein